MRTVVLILWFILVGAETNLLLGQDSGSKTTDAIDKAQQQSSGRSSPLPKRLFFSSANEAAEAALEALRKGSFQEKDAEDRMRNLGFESAAEVKEAKLGSPLPIFRAGLKQIVAFDPKTDDPNQLITDAGMTFFPITVRGTARTSITVFHQEEQWRWLRQGAPRLTSKLVKFRTPDTTFMLFIPGPHLHFLGSGSGAGLMLTPITSLKLGKDEFTAGKSEPARNIFAKLAPAGAQMLVPPTRR